MEVKRAQFEAQNLIINSLLMHLAVRDREMVEAMRAQFEQTPTSRNGGVSAGARDVALGILTSALAEADAPDVS